MFDFSEQALVELKRTSSRRTERSVMLVLSPLVSLMIDEVAELQKRGASAAILYGFTAQFTEKYTNNEEHAQYHLCNE